MAIKISNTTIIDDNRNIVSVKSASANVTVLASAQQSIDLSLGSYFRQSIQSNMSYTFSNIPTTTEFYTFIMEITTPSSGVTITWPTSLKWPKDTAPTLSISKTHVFVFITDDGGARWRAAAITDYTT